MVILLNKHVPFIFAQLSKTCGNKQKSTALIKGLTLRSFGYCPIESDVNRVFGLLLLPRFVFVFGILLQV